MPGWPLRENARECSKRAGSESRCRDCHPRASTRCALPGEQMCTSRGATAFSWLKSWSTAGDALCPPADSAEMSCSITLCCLMLSGSTGLIAELLLVARSRTARDWVGCCAARCTFTGNRWDVGWSHTSCYNTAHLSIHLSYVRSQDGSNHVHLTREQPSAKNVLP